MRALRFHEVGGPEVLRVDEVPAPPPPAEKQVQVHVRAGGLNFADTRFIRGQYFVKPRLPDIPGMEVAGEVVAVGAGVSTLREGDRVMALGASAFAERMNAHEGSVIPIPDALDFARAAALPIQGLTAHHVLFLMGRLSAGERVLIHAAGGGVGTLAIQIAKAHGAIVVASAGAAKHEIVRGLGADHVIDSRGDVLRQVKERVGEVDLVLEMIGGTESYKRNVACLAPFGRMIVYGAASGDTRGTCEPIGLMGKNLSVAGYYLTPLLARRELCVPPLVDLAARASTGALRVEIGGTFSLEEARAAFEKMEARDTVGKVILVPA
jgi:NADPH:quinone reductase